MRTALKLSLLGALGAIPLTMAANTASAAIACDADGDCWHMHEQYSYPPEARVVIHPDGWHWGAGERFAWREHEGRGYWNRGEWREF